MERVMSQLINEFSKKPDVELHLLLYGISREVFYTIPKNVKIHQPSFVFNNKFRVYFTIKTLFFIRKTVKKLSPETILNFGEYWNNFFLLAVIGLRFPVFISDRCQPNKSLGRFHDLLRKFLYPKSTGVIAQTEMAKSIFLKLYKHNNIKVIGNPINLMPKEDDKPRKNIVLIVGRLIKTKHHKELINLFVKINKPNWELHIIGGNALNQTNFESLNALVKNLNAENTVKLLGSKAEIFKYYHQSKIFAFTSSSEGFPNVIGEAMSAGLPVIAFDCIAGPSEMIKHHENGSLVEVRNFTEFQKELAAYMDSEMLIRKRGDKAKKTIQEFNASKIADKYFHFITNI